jgi:Protein of unknown function (DUF2442).
MTPDVTKVKVLPDFLLEVEFVNGEIRRFDVRPLLNYPAFVALREGSLFMAAEVVNGTVAWTDEIDLSPDTLYLRGELVQSNQEAEALVAV